MTPHTPLLATSHSFLTLEVTPKQLPGLPAVTQNNRSILFRAEDLGTLFGTAKLPTLQVSANEAINPAKHSSSITELPSHQNEIKWKPE